MNVIYYILVCFQRWPHISSHDNVYQPPGRCAGSRCAPACSRLSNSLPGWRGGVTSSGVATLLCASSRQKSTRFSIREPAAKGLTCCGSYQAWVRPEWLSAVGGSMGHTPPQHYPRVVGGDALFVLFKHACIIQHRGFQVSPQNA